MKDVSQIIGQQQSQQQKAPLTDIQKEAVAYFFMRVKAIYGQQYFTLMPDEKTEMIVKREFARQICDMDKCRMDAGFDALHRERQNNPANWEFLNLDKVCGLIKSGGKHWQQRVLEAKDAELRERPKALEQKRSEETKERVSSGIAELRKGLK